MATEVEVAPVAKAPVVKTPVVKTKKAKATPVPAEHPKYIDMIAAAISALKERGGSSRQAIAKYVKAHYKVGDSMDVHLKMALKSGATNGKLVRTKGAGASGSFKVAETKKAAVKKATVAKKPVVKKSTVAKKPAVKKPTAAKKSTPKKKATPVKKAAPKKTAAKPKKTAAKKPAAKKSPKKAAKKAAPKK